jgi:hypothetical protein
MAAGGRLDEVTQSCSSGRWRRRTHDRAPPCTRWGRRSLPGVDATFSPLFHDPRRGHQSAAPRGMASPVACTLCHGPGRVRRRLAICHPDHRRVPPRAGPVGMVCHRIRDAARRRCGRMEQRVLRTLLPPWCPITIEHLRQYWRAQLEFDAGIKSQQLARPLVLRGRRQSLIKQKFETVVVSVDQKVVSPEVRAPVLDCLHQTDEFPLISC